VPWLLIGAIVVVLVLVGGIGYFLVARNSAVSPWRPSDDNKDPSLAIPGIATTAYEGQHHVTPQQRVAYDKTPPYGGPHDGYWAACNGQVYPRAVRNENMVHGLEHGAVWIAYDPGLSPADVEVLKNLAKQPKVLVTPYEGLASAVVALAWEHRLNLASVNDPRLVQFANAFAGAVTAPEPKAACAGLGQPLISSATP
jgi:hypothetical protein